MKALILSALLLSFGAHAFASDSSNFSTDMTAISFIYTSSTGLDWKVAVQEFTEDAGVYLSLDEMSPQLEELLAIAKEKQPELGELSDRQLVKLMLKGVQ